MMRLPAETRIPIILKSRLVTDRPADAGESLMPQKPPATPADTFQIACDSHGPINERLRAPAKSSTSWSIASRMRFVGPDYCKLMDLDELLNTLTAAR